MAALSGCSSGYQWVVPDGADRLRELYYVFNKQFTVSVQQLESCTDKAKFDSNVD